MKKISRLFLLLNALVGVVITAIAQDHAGKPNSLVIFEENFNNWTDDSISGNGWTTILTSPYNYINAQSDAILFYKQEAANWVLLATPGIDMTNATMVIFDHKRYAAITGMNVKIGLMTNPADTNTFTMLDIINTSNTEWLTDTIFLSGYSGTRYLAFNAMGPPPYTLFFIDNVRVLGDQVQADWPSPVTGQAAVPAPVGGQYATVSWVNPSTQADGDPLTDLDSVSITANGLWAYKATDLVIGQAASVQVPVDSAGFYYFTLTAYNTAGASMPRSTDTVWVGLDTPGPAQNVVLTVVNDSTSHLSWSAPIAGEHGAYYNGIVDHYRIIRADGAEFTSGPDTLTLGDTLTTPGTYNYRVIAVNSSGAGAHGVSNAGAFYFQGYKLWEDYWVGVPAFGWTESGEGSPEQWHQGFGGYAGVTPPEAYFGGYSWPFYTGIHRMVSPVLNTTGLTALSLDFNYAVWYNSGSFTFRIESTSDGGATWQPAWSKVFTQVQDPTNLNVLIKNNDIGSAGFQFAFTFEGNNQDLGAFFLDALKAYPTVAVDLAPQALIIPDYLQPGNPVVATAQVKSYGSLDTTYTARLAILHGADTVFKTSLSSQIVAGTTQEITFPSWTSVEGDYTAHLLIVCPGDEKPGNNAMTKNFGVYNPSGTRTLVVCEEFTGTWCYYCPGAAMGLDDLIANHWPVAVVSYHSGDPYVTQAGLKMKTFYGIEGFPTVYFDGVDGVVGGTNNSSLYADYLPFVQARLAQAANATVAIEGLSLTDSTMTGKVVMSSASPITNQNLVVKIALTESHIPDAWQTMTEVNYAERAMFGGASGVKADLSGKSDTIPFSMVISKHWNQLHLELVAFLQDTLTREIFNGNKLSLAHLGMEPPSGPEMMIYPNPANDWVVVRSTNQIEAVYIYDCLGRMQKSFMYQGNNPVVDVSGLDMGLYMLRIRTASGEVSRKLVIR